jgi:hypothetical protein
MEKSKMIYMISIIVVTATLAVNPVLWCASSRKANLATGTYNGPARDMGKGRAHTFITLDANKKPTTIGIRLTEAALTGLPTEPPSDADGWEYVLPLPKEASISGYTHIVIDWDPKGHIPPGVYDKPHFDFHFYLISPEQREKITAKGEDLAKAHKQPAPEFMPEGYILPEGTEIARMGSHAIDPSSPEFNKLPFTKTFIYGFYDGSMAFLEPMVTIAFLETKPNVTDYIKLPKAYSQHGYYPTQYSVKYNQGQREYLISMEGLMYR